MNPGLSNPEKESDDESRILKCFGITKIMKKYVIHINLNVIAH
jgi:hypothetical protein